MPILPAADIPYGPDPAVWDAIGGKPAKPRLDDVIEDAERERTEHTVRVEVAHEFARWLSHERFGFFERDREHIVSGEVEKAFSNDLRIEHDAMVAFIAGMSVAFNAVNPSLIDREEKAIKEDALHFALSDWRHQHESGPNAVLAEAIPDTLGKYGMVAASILVDPTNADAGVRLRLADPATVFPLFEGEAGLAQLYRVYTADAGRVIGAYRTPDGKVDRAVHRIVAKHGDASRFDRTHLGRVTEYWDARWALIAFEDETVRLWEHNYGHVPWLVTIGGWGQQGFVTGPTRFVFEGEGDLAHAVIEIGTGTRADDLARQIQPFLWRRIPSVEMKEKVFTQFMTWIRVAKNPPLVHKQSQASAIIHDEIDVQRTEQGVTTIGAEDELGPLERLPTQDVLAPLMELLKQNDAMMAPVLLMGQNPNAQTSGSALEILAQSGLQHWSPLVRAAQNFYRRFGERYLNLVRDFGPLMGKPGQRGVLVVPDRHPPSRGGAAKPHHLTPHLIAATGARVEVELYRFDPMMVGPIANGLAIAADRGWIDKRTAVRLLSYTDDVEGVLASVRQDQLDEMPEILTAETVEQLYRLSEEAARRGDHESMRRLAMRAWTVASMMQARTDMMRSMAGAGADPAVMNALPGHQSGIAGAEGPMTGANFQGASLPGYGQPPGTQGGRPQQPAPPPGTIPTGGQPAG